MSLPTPYKIYQAPVTVATTLRGNAVLNAHEAMYLVCDAFIALGWTSKGAGTFSSAGLDGRRFTARTDWANGIGSGKVTWWCLENGAGAQVCFANNGDVGTDYANFVCTYSPDGGFTGGSTTAAPTAPHATSVPMSTAPFGSGGSGHGADVYTAHVVASTDAKNTRVLWFIGTFNFGIWALDQARNPRGTWSGNYFMNDQFGVNGATRGGLIENFQNVFGSTRIFTYANGTKIGIGGGHGAMFATSDIRGDLTTNWSTNVTALNGLTGKYDISSMRVGVPGTGVAAVRGRFGVCPDLFLLPKLSDGSSTSKFTSGSTAPLAGTREWITYGDLLIPWGGGAVNGDVGDFDYFDDNGGCVCPEPPEPPPPPPAAPVSGPTLRYDAALDPLGAGIVRPFRRTEHQDFATDSGVPLVMSCIGQVLGTARGTFPWEPDFGSDLHKLRHKSQEPTFLDLCRIYSSEAIKRWEPRADVTKVEIETSKLPTPQRNNVGIVVHVRIGGKTFKVPTKL